MTTRSRAAAAGFACALALLLVLAPHATAAPATAAAPSVTGSSAGLTTAGAQARVPVAGPVSQAFIESLHDPLAGVFGRRPAPITTRITAAAERRLSARLAGTLPATYDLRDEDRVPPVRDQGSLGTCWAFANLASVESLLLPAESLDFSEDNLITRSGFGPFPVPYNAYTWGGWDYMAVAYMARWAGPVLEADDPYPKSADPDVTAPKVNHVVKHLQDAVMLPGRTGPLDNDLLKQLVMHNGALSVGMFYNAAFDSSKRHTGDWQAAYYCDVAAGETYKGYSVAENHGVDIIGWDDAYPASAFSATSGTPPGDGAFLVRNSWGEGYGDDGYVWISYYDRSFAFGPCTSYSRVDDTTSYRRIYQYDTLGWTESLGYPDVADSSIAWGANRFSAKATERIVALGFYAPVAGTGYQLWAGPTLKSLTLRGQGTVQLPGYTTIDLDTPLPVTKGKRFVVAVRLSTPGTAQPLAVESPSTSESYRNHAVAATGQSFMRYGDADAWTDLASGGDTPDTSVCLKAFSAR